MSSEERDQIEDIGWFLDHHYSQFAIMGIFGTITVFLNTQWPGGTQTLPARLATVASLVIFAIAAFWIAGESFARITTEGGWPTITDIAYILIFLCTTILGVVIINATSLFSEASQIVGELTLSVCLILIYTRFTPIVDYVTNGEDYEHADPYTSSFLAVFGIFWFLDVYQEYIIRQFSDVLGFQDLTIVPFVALLIPVHFAFTESFIGLSKIVRVLENSFGNIRSSLIGPWPIEVSIGVVVSGLMVLSEQTESVAEAATGADIGYYDLLGMPSTQFTFFHWCAMFLIILLLIFGYRKGVIQAPAYQFIAQILAVLFVSIVAVEVLFIVPTGTRALTPLISGPVSSPL